MRPLLAFLLLAGQALAMGKRPFQGSPYQHAVLSYQAGDFAEAGAVFKSEPGLRAAWLALLFERQGYGALEIELAASAEPWEQWMLARALANQGKWERCLKLLEGRDSREAALLRAEALDATGSTMAAGAWKRALEREKRNPQAALAQFKAAEFSARQGDREGAEARYKRAEKLDPAAASVHGRLAQIYIESGRHADAKTRLERALKVDPLDAEARDCLNLLLRAQPALHAAAKEREARRDSERLEKKNPVVAARSARDGEPRLRIGVLPLASRFRFRSGTQLRVDPLGLTLAAGAVFEISLSGKRWRLAQHDARGSSLVAELDGRSAWLRQQDPSGTTALFDVDFGKGYFWAGTEDRSFRGDLEIVIEGFKGVSAVNELPIDDYLFGVLPAEMPPSWPKEALFSQAVAARGDALGKRGRHKAQGFDLCSDVHCAMYRGVGGESPASSHAVTATAGEVLEEGGRLVPVLYMNSCGGHTQDAWDAWSGEPRRSSHAVLDAPKGPAFPLDPKQLLDWLEDPRDQSGAWCGKSSTGPYCEYRWAARVGRDELGATVSRRHPVGRLLAVEPLERSASGHVKRVRFSGTAGSSVGSSDYIRSAIKGLRSNLFYVESRRNPEGEPLEFIFHGAGWGHGVGLCQRGAAAMAAAGKKHGEILSHYFKGGSVKRRY